MPEGRVEEKIQVSSLKIAKESRTQGGNEEIINGHSSLGASPKGLVFFTIKTVSGREGSIGWLYRISGTSTVFWIVLTMLGWHLTSVFESHFKTGGQIP